MPRRRYRRAAPESSPSPVSIRVGHRNSRTRYQEIQVTGAPSDRGLFARLVEDQVRHHPNDPLILSINGYQPWLGDILHSCIEDDWHDMADLDRVVQYATTMQFPEKASKRGRWVPWTFIIDHINVPQVYYWSVNMDPPVLDESPSPRMKELRFRTGVWFCGKGACRLNRSVSVTIIFTKPTPVAEHIVTKQLFNYLLSDSDFNQPRDDEEGICWTFQRLFYLLTDWQNIIGELLSRLDEAEINSHDRYMPVKARTRRMHYEVDRIYEMKEYLHFHTRSFGKLQRLRNDVPEGERQDPLWYDMDDAVEDLGQFEATLDGLKERFNNLIELEFNISNATQTDNSAFLMGVATLFLPVSFLASLFGISTADWPMQWYAYIAVPVFALSVFFTAAFPVARRRIQKVTGPISERRLQLQPQQFTMLEKDAFGSNLSRDSGRSLRREPGRGSGVKRRSNSAQTHFHADNHLSRTSKTKRTPGPSKHFDFQDKEISSLRRRREAANHTIVI
ncbi:hypothetical protein BST61_g9562 [Cercospora zeina]